jgi:hypothetical protein
VIRLPSSLTSDAKTATLTFKLNRRGERSIRRGFSMTGYTKIVFALLAWVARHPEIRP